MDLREIMRQHSFAVVGNTVEEGKYAKQIKDGLIEKGYRVYAVGKELASLNDVPGEIDIVDLCIHPAKGIQLLQECRKPYKCVVIQPGAESDEIESWLAQNGHDYIKGCLLVGMRLYTGPRAVWD